jgi:1-deoxy-D-xylulose-5-phosphate synthase
MASMALEIADRVGDHGIGVTVVDPGWVKPLASELVTMAAGHKMVVTLEDNGRVGGVGAAVALLLQDNDVDTPVREYGIPQRFLAQGKQAEVLAEVGLTARGIARLVVEAVARRDPDLEAGSAAPADVDRCGGAAGPDLPASGQR